MVVHWWRNDAHLRVKRGITPGRIESSVIVQGSNVREPLVVVHVVVVVVVVVVPFPMGKSMRRHWSWVRLVCAACSHRR